MQTLKQRSAYSQLLPSSSPQATPCPSNLSSQLLLSSPLPQVLLSTQQVLLLRVVISRCQGKVNQRQDQLSIRPCMAPTWIIKEPQMALCKE